ncbi:carboxypeptidase-like regulatory domain-containing protein [Formosa sp. PL04]|uniref:carboxypeptidase-like regulatory domain-containing protein n=1 Tax=Formosa sp. PL04 TaxID=3081755 RepID=UPI0029825C5F|nr:carboxypeptidase-like regulatory domain-containing protein [Formosa sp. PL04]MDW5287408.1 outer membrane beta-barrel protein [Formosa sp. PL04]
MKKGLIILLLLAANLSFGQLKFEGVVKDSIGNPLELANIIAINTESQSLESYGITNPEGEYKLSLSKNSNYNIQVSYIGMKTEQIKLETTDKNVYKTFSLNSDNTLDEVELIYEMPVTVKGDTIIYNADSFKNGTERKLEDILKKLPGLEVNDDGEIEVEGNVVSKVMIDGKDFFDGDSKLATKNIPSSAIDKIEVLKNFAEIGQLSGVTNNQDNVAINIKLKEGKKNFWFGDITGGAGIANEDGLYVFQPKLFYYSPKYSINLIGDLNNIGEIAFSRRDYFNFTGGFRAPSSKSGTNIDLGGNSLGFATLQNNRAKDINTKFGAANFSYSPNEALDFSGFAIFSSSIIDMQIDNSIIYTNTDLGVPDEITESNTTQNSDLGMLKLSVGYKPNTDNQLDYDIMGRVSKESQNQSEVSSVLGQTLQYESSSPFSINQNINYYYTLSEKHIFAFYAQHLWQDEDPFYNALIEQKSTYEDAADALGLNNMQIDYNVNQDKRVKSNQIDAKADYYNVLNSKSNINITLGTIYSYQNFNSNIFQTLDDGSTFNPTPTINNGLSVNDIQYSFSDVYVGLHYTLKAGMFTFAPGASVHAYSSNNEQFGVDYNNDFFKILPDLDVRLQLKKSEQLVFNYSMQTQFTDVTQLAEGLVMNNYNSFFNGNDALDNAISHAVRLAYSSFNMFNYTNVYANVSYNKSIDKIRNITNFESVIRSNSPFNSDYADETVSASGRYQRQFGKFKTSASARFNYSKFNQFIQDVRSVNENYTQNYGLGVSSNFREAPNFEIGYNYSIQDNDQGQTRTKFFTSSPSAEFNALIWKVLTFKTDYTYNNFSDEEGPINNYEFWNASLAYRKDKDSKWEFELKATNLLDTETQSQSSADDISVRATDYYIQPRYVTLRAIYSL